MAICDAGTGSLVLLPKPSSNWNPRLKLGIVDHGLVDSRLSETGFMDAADDSCVCSIDDVTATVCEL